MAAVAAAGLAGVRFSPVTLVRAAVASGASARDGWAGSPAPRSAAFAGPGAKAAAVDTAGPAARAWERRSRRVRWRRSDHRSKGRSLLAGAVAGAVAAAEATHDAEADRSRGGRRRRSHSPLREPQRSGRPTAAKRSPLREPLLARPGQRRRL